MISLKKMSMTQKAFSVLAFCHVCVHGGKGYPCLYRCIHDECINMPKSWQAFSCFSRMSVWVKRPKNNVLPVFIAQWLKLFKDTSVNTSMFNILNSSKWHEFSYPNWYKLFWWMLKHWSTWDRLFLFFCLKKEALTSQG